MTDIGIVGVGNMGAPMAANLLKAGHRLKAFDVSRDAVAKVAAGGAEAAESAAAAAADVGVLITMLPAGPQVREVYEQAVFEAAAPGTLFIDCSTIDVDTARGVAAQASARGFDMLDAPVSGGVGGAQAATLTFMVGGTDAAFARGKPVLQAMGKNIVHAGASGNGQVAKVCNNMILGASMIAVGEAFVMAEALGLDKQTLYDIVSTATGSCWALNTYCPVPGPVPTSPANRDYQAGFTAAMMLKDLRLSQSAAQSAGVATPMGAAAAALYALFCNSGHDGLDFSGIVKMIRGDD